MKRAPGIINHNSQLWLKTRGSFRSETKISRTSVKNVNHHLHIGASQKIECMYKHTILIARITTEDNSIYLIVLLGSINIALGNSWLMKRTYFHFPFLLLFFSFGRVQREQLTAIFSLMKEKAETFGDMSETDIKEQLKLYDM